MKLAETNPIVSDTTGAAVNAMPSQTGWELVGNTIFSLLLIVGILFALSWLMKRSPLAKVRAGMALEVKGGARLGAREKLVVVRYHDSELLLGVTPGQVTLLSRDSETSREFSEALRHSTGVAERSER